MPTWLKVLLILDHAAVARDNHRHNKGRPLTLARAVLLIAAVLLLVILTQVVWNFQV